jgi:hypothetical protein
MKRIFLAAFLMDVPAWGQVPNMALVPWYSATPPTSCYAALPVYIIAPGYAGAGNLYGNTSPSTGTTCALLGSAATGGTASGDLSGSYPNPTVVGINGVPLPTPPVSNTPGDLACAVGSDPTVGPWSPTSASSTASTLTFTGTALPRWFITGQLMQCQGWTPAGYNGAFTVATGAPASTTTITATNAANPGASSIAGTCSLVCSNTADAIAIGSKVQFANTSPALTLGNQLSFKTQWQFTSFATATTATVRFAGYYGAVQAFLTTNSLTWGAVNQGYPGDVTLNGISDSSTQLNTTPLVTGPFNNYPFVLANIDLQPLPVTSGNKYSLSVYFAPTGCCTGTFTYSSGGTACSNGTQVVNNFNNSCNTATNCAQTAGTISVSGNIPTGNITFTSPGCACTAIPTTGQVASCTGVTTFSNVGGALRGGAGNGILVLNSKTTQ